MKYNNKVKNIAKSVIDLEIQALKKLKKSINSSFIEAVNAIVNCKSKIIVCGVGKSFLIASKVSSTMSSIGCPSFSINANECSHGDLGSISKNDVLIIISNSGSTNEIKPVIQYCNRHKISLIGITSNIKSILYKASDIKLLIPKVEEAGLSIVPTSSTTEQIAIGDCLAVAALSIKKFNRKKFKIFHPHGSIGNQLKTAEDLMLDKKGIPFIYEKSDMKKALNIITKKKLGVLIAINRNKMTTGILTDGQIRRSNQKKGDLSNLKVRDIMTKSPISINKDTLAAKSLAIMSDKKITCLCVHKGNRTRKTIGILHIHHILNANIH
ncbi:MAG: arabinose-5-phosphate isomerase [Candidatus Pelagibacter sp.]|nr:arabinose-5-phosphate isomerase [Candidatus Pelagibacter sp.]|tara:strand:- start:3663 stop:4637 length:975 start_codon:yes stop_codon:yes gene_type:complete